MTTQKGEREEALIARLRKEAAWQADYYAGAPCSEILSEAADTIERLLSSSKAEGEMREALEKLFVLMDAADDALDKDTYDQNVRDNFDAPDDAEYVVRSGTTRKCNAVFVAIEKLRGTLSPKKDGT